MATALPSRDAWDTEVVGRRVVQYVLDVLISALIVLPLTLLVGIGANSDSGTTAWAVLAGLLCGLLTLFWYWVLRPVGTGQTWGMRLLGLRVVRADRSPLTTRDAVARLLLLVVDGLVGLIAMRLSARRQRLGDVVAGTLVVRDRRVLRARGGVVRATLPRDCPRGV
ncbi:RDD family protein [Streptomyces sp. NPDC056628]|uniref:RDD family protein n=1 Tax=Streptomyces sp. NPDC056628 TaxID=3345882 RepID=UPI00367E753B